MTRNKRIFFSIILLVLMCASVLVTLSACSLSDLASGVHRHSRGVYYTVYPLRRYAIVHGFDKTDDVAQIYTIPAYVSYMAFKCRVKKFESPKNTKDLGLDWYDIVHDGGYAKQLVVPNTVESLSLSAADDDLKQLTTITVDDTNRNYKSVDGVLYSADGSEMLFYPPAKVSSIFTMPKEVTTISGNANFNKKESVLEFDVESGSQTFSTINGAIYTLDGSKLLYYPCGKHTDTFVIPKQMTQFDCAFFNANKDIKYFKVEEGNRFFSVIDGDVYSADGSILLFRKLRDDNKALALPQSVKIVCNDTLNGVDYLYLPASLEKIVFKTNFFYREINDSNPLGRVQYVFFESDTVPYYARYVLFTSAYFGVTLDQFWAAVDGDFGELVSVKI